MHFRRSIIVAELWPPEVARCWKFLRIFCVFFLEKWLTGKFSKFCSERIHRLTDRRVVFKFREIGKVVRYLSDKKQQNFAWLSRCRCCADRAQNLPGPALVNVLKVLQIWYSHQFTVPEVIRECVNTVKTGCKVFPIFRWSLASSRIITSHMRSRIHVQRRRSCYVLYFRSMRGRKVSSCKITFKVSQCHWCWWQYHV